MAESQAKIIKRYPNRKLYDTESSSYVTLDDIAKMVKSGRDLRIIDHKTGDDLTKQTLAQIVFEEEKRKKSVLPIGTLKELIQQRGEQVREFVDRFVHDNPLTHAKEKAEEEMQQLLKKGETAREESARFFRELIGGYTRGFEEIQRKFDDRIREVGDRLAALPSVLGDMKLILERLEKVEARVEELERRLDKAEGKRPVVKEKE